MQMLVRPHVVVPGAERLQLEPEFLSIDDRDGVEVPLQCSEETFNTAVLSGAMQLDGLQANAEQPQPLTNQARVEADLVIDTDVCRQAVPTECRDDGPENRKAALIRQCSEFQAGARAVVDQAKEDVLSASQIGLAGQVERPCPVSPSGYGNAMLERASKHNDVVFGLTQAVSHVSLADRDPAIGELSVEDFRNHAAPCIRGPGFQPDQLLAYPVRLGWMPAKGGARRVGKSRLAVRVRVSGRRTAKQPLATKQ